MFIRQALAGFRKATELYQRQGNQEMYQNALEQIRGFTLPCGPGAL